MPGASGQLTNGASINLTDRAEATDIHQDIQLSKQGLHNMPDSSFTHDTETPNPKAAYEDELSTHRKCLDDIGSRADT